ncbi:MAG: InlB B-repeat-containing protein, partial [Paludibacteraceae bacterium]|nr:InlB B-repeat-containing protein [Paludibacteraceae bacterium]
MTISETAKATAKKPSTYGNDCLLEWTGNFTGDVSVSVKDNKEHVGVFVITVPEAKYSVTYKAGDGTGDDVVDSDAKTVKAFADCSFTAPSGYEFKEWQDGSSNVVAAGATVSADMTLTAIYRLIPTKYTVTYNLNGASGDAPTETDKAEGDVFNLAAAPNWAGHAFDGWLCSADAAVKVAGSSYTMTAAATTFTAQWHEVDCKIYSWTGEIGTAEVTSDGNASIADGKLILSGSAGRIKLTPASGTFKAGDVVTVSGYTGNASKKFGVYVKNAAGSSNIATAEETTLGDGFATATLSADADYVFLARKESTTMNVLTCEIHRACAEGVAAGLAYATTEVAKTEGDAAFTNPLTNANGLVIAGYKSSNTAVATVATNGQVTVVGPGSATITANSAVQTKAGTLYAAGTASYTLTVAALPKYHVTYDLNGGSGDVAEVDHKAGEKFTLHDGVTGVTAPGSKTFVNWKDQDDALFDGGVEYTMPAKDVTLTAQWAGDVYTVKFMDGETVLDTKVVEVGSHPTDIEHPTKPLFTFAAWQLSGSDVNLDEVSGTKDAIVTLTARWAKAYASNADFEAYILANTGEAGDADKAEAYVKSLNYALSTKTNTTFDANTGSNNGAYAGLKIKNAGTTLSWNVVAGKVVELKAGVMVNSNGSLSINGGEAQAISGGSTGSGDNFKTHYFYNAAEALYVFTSPTGDARVIKAITMRDPYTVSFEAHGDADPSALPGQPSVTLPAATNGTASLLGWFDAETGGNKIGDAGDSYTPTANITLHAQWEAVSTDARLSAITLSDMSGVWSPAFDPEVVNYTYTMPYPTAAVPTITGATAVNANAKAPVIDAQAANWGDVAHIHGVAESDDTKDYYITMKIAPKDGVSIIKVATTGGTNKTVTGLYAGDGDVNLSSSKKMDNGKYIGFILNGTTLQTGDRINVHTTQAANTGGSHIIFYDNMTDKNELYETGEIGGTGDNIFTINAEMEGKATAYVYRSNADAAHQWNGYVDFIEVTRPMNPMLTAITINSRAGEIDPLDDKHFNVQIPYEADLAALTIVPTIVRNAPHATTPEAVISNAGAWILGDNTYRIMDKDGDYTDYTITLDRDVLKHTVSFNTHGGSAVPSVEVVDGQKLAAAPADPTKDDYLFQGWAETEDGTIVDVTSFTITADKEFHAV